MLVSIIIPCYNVATYLADALDSALAQDYPNIEIICVDNNSIDDTRTILENYALCYPDKVNFLSEPTQGAPAARNTGWRFSRGEWIQFLDADDTLKTNKISRQVAIIKQSNQQASFLVGTPIYVDANEVEHVVMPAKNAWLGLMHGKQLGNTVANLWSKKILLKINGWDESLPDAQDPYLMFSFLKENDNLLIDKIPSTYCKTRADGSHISWQDPKGRFKRQLELRIQMIAYLKEEKPIFYIENEQLILSLALRLLRLCATEDLFLALEYKQKILPVFFKPVANRQTEIPLVYAKVFSMTGFFMIESSRLLVGKLLSSNIKNKLKKWINWKKN